LAFEHFDLVDDAFGGAVTVGQGQTSDDGIVVLVECVDEGVVQGR
jgi:hypothetical protein